MMHARDNGRGTPASEEEPEPVEHHRDAVSKAGEVVEVHESPHGPGEDAAKVEATDLSHRMVVADLGNAALVPVAEGLARALLERALDRPGDGSSLLHGRGAHAGHRVAVVLDESHVADREHLRVARQRQVWSDD